MNKEQMLLDALNRLGNFTTVTQEFSEEQLGVIYELMDMVNQQHKVSGVDTEKLKALPIYVVRVSAWDDASEGEKAPFIERAEELTRDTLFCSRVWSAWGYGTMTEDDFSDATEDFDFIDAVARAIWEGH